MSPIKKIFLLRVFLRIAGILLSIFLLVIAIRRDIHYNNDYPGDLRNRVVGARLIEDGKIPYFYKWRPADGLRYYDPSAFADPKVSITTTTPFFQDLLRPICDLPEARISDIWFLLEYVMMAIMILIALSFCASERLKWVVWFVALALLFTDAWKSLMSAGQMYIVLPFLCSLFLFSLYRAKQGWSFLWCGILAATLILIRPNAAIFFLPFVLVLRQWKMKNILLLALPLCIGLLWIGANDFQRTLWKNYFSFLRESIHLHQGEPYEKVSFDTDPKFAEWEGIVLKDVNTIHSSDPDGVHSENGNFFVLYRLLFHRKISTTMLAVLGYSSILLLFLSFAYYRAVKYKDPWHKGPWRNELPVLTIFGFCLYMISDLFSPVYRHQYYTTQWIFVILLFWSLSKRRNERVCALLVGLGIFLNMINVEFLKMEHTIGEYLILLSLLLFSFLYYRRTGVQTV